MKKKIFQILILSFLFLSCSGGTLDLNSSENQPQNNTYTIGVFGGSISSTKQSEAGKNIWRNELGPEFIVETCGVSGAGFSTKTNNNVPSQIQKSKVFDVYILWASTNDFSYKSEVGDIDTKDLATQSGGINYSLDLIKSKNPKALILFFTTLPNFAQNEGALNSYVEGQISLCKKNNIPYLDQSKLSGLTKENSSIYFTSDMVHLNEEGYKFIAPMQVNFLKQNTLSLKSITGLTESVNKTTIRCYPNPFCEKVTIEVQSHENQTLQVDIFDLSGKLIRNICNRKAERWDQLVWDGKNDSGISQPLGTYLIKANNQSVKIILQK